ncbi:type II toxin-antitoxin system HicB family antitoxin [Microbulbifer harenosus]|uniref:Type II toxin-antitoxin system HicB family antitoxin n=1 Tax=Microbulbifer harenosus TaxID=2576840 RepID=A0ABY2UMU7_9GAMM|nr:type II toxin-antitoxin system HicB family antitoxin [Microbulbifer harenosus]TLM79935.1 type II toxin-antitoxin system HicB family antitoxin [Microbulbifer harenosus]
MSKLLSYKGYKGSVEYDLDEGFLYGKILFIRDLVNYEAEDIKGIKAAFEEAVDDYIEDCKALGFEPNVSLSGTFNVRIGPELHEYACIKAAEDKVSINEYIKRLVAADQSGKREIHTHTHNHVHAGHSFRVSLGLQQVNEDIWESRKSNFAQFFKSDFKLAHH